MNSVEFGKKCRPHNIKYRDIFGNVPCSRDECFGALRRAIETRCELSAIVPRKKMPLKEGVRI